MTKKHYINELHKLGYACFDMLKTHMEKGTESTANVSCIALLKIIKDILGNDFGTDDKDITVNAWKFYEEKEEE